MDFTLSAVENSLTRYLDSSDSLASSQSINSTINAISTELSNFSTESKIFDELGAYNTFVRPKSYVVGERKEFEERNGTIIYKNIYVTAEHIPIGRVLKSFFELSGVFRETMTYLQKLEFNADKIQCNYVQGALWREKKKFGNKIVLPLILYFDDFETDNPLGSHQGLAKCGAVYVTIACLPPEF